jgi:hypothetical protein
MLRDAIWSIQVCRVLVPTERARRCSRANATACDHDAPGPAAPAGATSCSSCCTFDNRIGTRPGIGNPLPVGAAAVGTTLFLLSSRSSGDHPAIQALAHSTPFPERYPRPARSLCIASVMYCAAALLFYFRSLTTQPNRSRFRAPILFPSAWFFDSYRMMYYV